MSWIANVYWGTATPFAGVSSPYKAAIIARGDTLPALDGTTVNPVTVTNADTLSSTYGIATTDNAYVAAVDFFAGGGQQLLVYVVSGAGETITDSELVGIKDGVNTGFYFGTSPVTSVANVEFNWQGSGWYAQDLTTNYTLNTVNGSVAGLNVVEMKWSGTTTEFSGYIPTAGDRIRADLTVPALAGAFSALSDPSAQFSLFAFGYDQSLAQNVATVESGDKYYADECVGGKGWLDDVMLGASMATQFNTVGKRCMFFASLPDKVRPTNIIYSGYASGTTYNDNASKYVDLPDIIGQNKFIALFSSKQETAGSDIAVAAMGGLSADHPRKPATFFPIANYSQLSWPAMDEILTWKSNAINPLTKEYFSSGNSVVMIAGNKTFGVGTESTINYIRCKNILTNMLLDNLKTLLMSRTVQYDYKGIMRVRNTIAATLNSAYNEGYIDDTTFTITIPILAYAKDEKRLSDEDLAILTAARNSGVLQNITVTYKWFGDIESITINALVNN
jgi:hypothetical protein